MTEQTKYDRAKVKEAVEYNGDTLINCRKVFAAHGGTAYAVWLADGTSKQNYICIFVKDQYGDFIENDCVPYETREEVENFIADFEYNQRVIEKDPECRAVEDDEDDSLYDYAEEDDSDYFADFGVWDDE